LGDGRYTALAADTKPTNAVVNAELWVTDTDDIFRYNGTSWVLLSADDKTETLSGKTISNDSNTFPFLGAYDAIIYKSGTTYKSKKYDGTLLASSTTLSGVVQAALDVTGLIVWPRCGGTYSLTAAHTGWIVKPDTTLVMSRGTFVVIPAGYTGTVFRIDDTTGGDHDAHRITIQGGRYVEANVPASDWTWLEMISGSNTGGTGGIWNCQIRDMFVSRPGTGIKLTATSGSSAWINGNTFDSITIDKPNIGMLFNQSAAVGISTPGIHRNHFSNVVVQADDSFDTGIYAMSDGIKDISGVNNVFDNCKVWDTTVSNNDCNITNKASDTVIIGGLMCRQPYDWEVKNDFGRRTYVYGEPHAVGTNTAISNPFLRKTGTFYGQSGTSSTIVVGDGLLNALATHGTGTYTGQTPSADGSPRRIDTSSTIATIAGIRTSTTPFCRHFNPIVITRFKNEVNTNQRIFVGFISSPTAPTHNTADDPLVSLTGYGLYHSTSHGTSASNWLVCKNTGSATSTFTDTGIAANITTVQTLYIAAYEDGPKFQWRIGNTTGQIGEDTTTIPGAFTVLGFGIYIDNVTAAFKRIDVFDMFAKEGRPNPVP
jgi:hypothetical protein